MRAVIVRSRNRAQHRPALPRVLREQTFFGRRYEPAQTNELIIVLNWYEELKQLVPTDE